MKTVLQLGKKLFHGTLESFETDIQPGSYDGILWTADNSVIAQCYIPLAGSTYILGIEAIVEPNSNQIIQKFQQYLGIHYDYARVSWNDKSEAQSYPSPRLENFTTNRKDYQTWNDYRRAYSNEVVRKLQRLNWPQKRNMWLLNVSDTMTDFFRPQEKAVGRLFVFSVTTPLQLFDQTLNGQIEFDPTTIRPYFNFELFENLKKRGFDGVKIADAAQTELGNLGHVSYGLFPQAMKKLQVETILPATHPDLSTNTDTWVTPEYKMFQERERQKNLLDEKA